jgi:hypothetical protein
MTDPCETFPIDMTADIFDPFNAAIVGIHGVTFSEFAEENPAEAYRVLTHALGSLVGTAEEVITKSGNKVTRSMDGDQAISGFAESLFRESTVDTDMHPINVVVSVIEAPNFRDRIRGRSPELRQVAAFRVEPPNLAF